MALPQNRQVREIFEGLVGDYRGEANTVANLEEVVELLQTRLGGLGIKVTTASASASTSAAPPVSQADKFGLATWLGSVALPDDSRFKDWRTGVVDALTALSALAGNVCRGADKSDGKAEEKARLAHSRAVLAREIAEAHRSKWRDTLTTGGTHADRAVLDALVSTETALVRADADCQVWADVLRVLVTPLVAGLAARLDQRTLALAAKGAPWVTLCAADTLLVVYNALELEVRRARAQVAAVAAVQSARQGDGESVAAFELRQRELWLQAGNVGVPPAYQLLGQLRSTVRGTLQSQLREIIAAVKLLEPAPLPMKEGMHYSASSLLHAVTAQPSLLSVDFLAVGCERSLLVRLAAQAEQRVLASAQTLGGQAVAALSDDDGSTDDDEEVAAVAAQVTPGRTRGRRWQRKGRSGASGGAGGGGGEGAVASKTSTVTAPAPTAAKVAVNTRLCYICNKPGHTMWVCPDRSAEKIAVARVAHNLRPAGN